MKLATILLFSLFAALKAATIDDLTWTIEGGEVTITDCASNATGILEIPDTIEGLPVSTIGFRAFIHCGNLTEINVPEGVLTIEIDGERTLSPSC